MGTYTQSGASTETTLAGTYVATDSESSSTEAAGTTDFTANTLTEAWGGSEASSHEESGYNGPNTYAMTQTNSGAISATETSGSLSGYDFDLVDKDQGTFTLSESSTNVGGGSTDSGSGSYSIELNPNDSEPPSGTYVAGGSVHDVETTSTTFAGSGYSTLDGIVSTLTAIDRSDLRTVTPIGDQAVGTYTITTNDSATSETISTTTESTVESADGIGGTHAIGNTDTSSPSSSVGSTQTGNWITGSYTLSSETSLTPSDVDVSNDDVAATGLATSEDDDDTDLTHSTQNGESTINQTGNVYSSTYSQWQFSSPGGTVTDTATDNSDDQPGDGETAASAETSRSTESWSEGETILMTGTVVSGGFSQTAFNSDSPYAEDNAQNSAGHEYSHADR